MSCSSRRPPSSPAPAAIWDHPSKDTSVTPNVHGRMENVSTHQGWPPSVLESLTMVRTIRFVCMDVSSFSFFLSPPVFHLYLSQTSVGWSLGNSFPGDKQLSSGRCNTEPKPVNHVFKEVSIPLGVKSALFYQGQLGPEGLASPFSSCPLSTMLPVAHSAGRSVPAQSLPFTVPSF